MIRKRRAVAAFVVVSAAVIAACLGPKLGTVEQADIVVSSGPSAQISPNPVMVGSQGSATITLSSAGAGTTVMDQVDTISIATCNSQWTVQASLPMTVSRSCGSGGSTVSNAMLENAPHAQGYVTGDAEETMCFDMPGMFQVTFKPTSATASAQCTVQISGKNTMSGSAFPPVSVTVHASATAPAAGIDVTPTVINIGQVRVGNSGSASFNIRNTGTALLDAGPITASRPEYSINPGSAMGIPQNQSVPITVQCTPAGSGNLDTTISVPNNATSPKSVMALCEGIVTNLNVNAVSIVARVGEATDVDVPIAAGNVPSTLNAFSIPSHPGLSIAAMPSPMPHALGSNASTQPGNHLKLRYLPTAAHAKMDLANLRITHDGTLTRDVALSVTALLTEIEVNPDVIDFGPICAGTSEMKTVKVRAPSPGHFTVNTITQPAAPFGLTGPMGKRVAGGGAEEVEFTATVAPPAGAGAGPMMATGALNTDIPNKNKVDLMFEAEVLPGGIGASPPTHEFGGVARAAVSTARMIDVRNCSTAPLKIDTAGFQGDAATEYSIVISPPEGMTPTLQPQQTVAYGVVLNPQTAGAKTARFVVTSGGSSSSVDLIGTGLGATDGSDSGEKSYYGACDGGSSGAGLWTLAVLLGLRRRRKK